MDDDEPDLDELKRDAEAGVVEAQYQLGEALWVDAESDAEFLDAFRWLERAARRRNGEAWRLLAESALEGIGHAEARPELALRIADAGWRRSSDAACCVIAADALSELGRQEEAVSRLRLGAVHGSSDAMCSLGFHLRYGIGVRRDFVEMARWYMRAARLGSISAMHNLAICRKNGEGVRASMPRALRWYRRAAAHGNQGSARYLAEASIDGRGVPLQPELGRAELERLAVEESDAEAAYGLADRLLYGKGLPEDHEDAQRWFRWAIDMGSAAAAADLGFAYFSGNKLERNVDEAVRLYRWAAERGNGIGLGNLGLCYRDGDGVPRDPVEALRLFELAATKDNADAAYLAAKHHLGECADASPQRAVQLLEGVLDEEDPDCLRLLADCREQGRGCAADPAEAARLRVVAAELEGEEAAEDHDESD